MNLWRKIVCCIPTRNWSIIGDVIVLFTEVAIKVIYKLPILWKLSLGDFVNIKGDGDAILHESGLNMLQIIGILILILGMEVDFLCGRVGMKMIQDPAVDYSIS